jgi:hypothetical protein
MDSFRLSILSIALIWACVSVRASGQSVSHHGSIFGTAVDSTGRPLADVQVEIEDLKLSVRSSAQGIFRLDSVEAGSYTLAGRRLGFKPIVVPLRVAANEVTYADLVFRATVDRLAPVTVSGVASSAAPSTGFDERMIDGQGTYITAADIEKLNPARVSQILRRVPTLRVAPNGEVFSGRGKVSLLSKACANGLPIYLDNVLLGGGTEDDPSSLSDGFFGKASPQNPNARAAIDLVNPTSIAGIEIYSGPSTIPPSVQGSNSSCGAILIWTKRK